MVPLPPELADPLDHLRAQLLEINGAEHSCMTAAVASASHGTSPLPQAQAIMARCRQSSAAAATNAIDTFRDECLLLGAHAGSLTQAAILAVTATNVSAFWAKSESCAAALASETAAQLPAQGPDQTTQAIDTVYRDRAASINRYFTQLTTEQLTT